MMRNLITIQFELNIVKTVEQKQNLLKYTESVDFYKY